MVPLKVPLNNYCVLSDILIIIHGTKFSVLRATLLIAMKLRTVKEHQSYVHNVTEYEFSYFMSFTVQMDLLNMKLWLSPGSLN